MDKVLVVAKEIQVGNTVVMGASKESTVTVTHLEPHTSCKGIKRIIAETTNGTYLIHPEHEYYVLEGKGKVIPMETTDLTPDYTALRERFTQEFVNECKLVANNTAVENEAIATVHPILAALNVAMQSVDSTAAFNELRQVVADMTKIVAAANERD